jgi:hypothetical protein
VKFSLMCHGVVMLCVEKKIMSTVCLNSFAGPLAAYQEPCMKKMRRGFW